MARMPLFCDLLLQEKKPAKSRTLLKSSILVPLCLVSLNRTEFQNIMLSFIAGHLPSQGRVGEGKEKEWLVQKVLLRWKNEGRCLF